MSNRITFHFKKGRKPKNLQERIEQFAKRAVKRAIQEQIMSDPDAPVSFDNSDLPVGSAPGGGYDIAKDWAKLPAATRCEWCKRNPGKITPQINGRNVAGPRCHDVLSKCAPDALAGFSDPDDMSSSEFDQGREDPDAYDQDREMYSAMSSGQRTSSTYPESVPEDPSREPVAKRRSTCARAKRSQMRLIARGAVPSLENIQSALGIKADGRYGPKTCAAIRKFQKRNGLRADGVVGPKTLKMLQGPGPQQEPQDDQTAQSRNMVDDLLKRNKLDNISLTKPYVQGSGRLVGYDPR